MNLALAFALVYLGGHTGRGADVKQQSRGALQNLGRSLKAAGLDFSHVVSTTVYLTDIRNLEAFDGVYREFFPRDLPARTELECHLMQPDSKVEITAVAVRDKSTRRIIRLSAGYAVDADGALFLSVLRPSGGTTIQEQTGQVMRNQEAILAAAGMTFADLVYSRIYLAEPSDYAGLNEVYRKFVTAPPPARATVNARPVELGHLVQIQSMAVRGSGVGRPSGEGITSPIHSYSVKAGKALYITGMTGRQPDGKFARNDIQAQTRQALETIREQLVRHGMTFADVTDSVVWLRDARHLAGMTEVYGEVVMAAPKVVVRIPPTGAEGLVEIMMTAANSTSDSRAQGRAR